MILPQFTCSYCGRRNNELKANLTVSQSGKTEKGHSVGFNIYKVERECSVCLRTHKTGVKN